MEVPDHIERQHFSTLWRLQQQVVEFNTTYKFKAWPEITQWLEYIYSTHYLRMELTQEFFDTHTGEFGNQELAEFKAHLEHTLKQKTQETLQKQIKNLHIFKFFPKHVLENLKQYTQLIAEEDFIQKEHRSLV